MGSTLELRHVDLGDRRLNRRLAKLVDDLSNAPEAVVSQASRDWAATSQGGNYHVSTAPKKMWVKHNARRGNE